MPQFIFWLSLTQQDCSIFVVLLLLLNLVETGHVQMWALTVTQMAAEMLWSHKLCFLQIIFPALVHAEARVWSCHPTAAAAASQIQLHSSGFVLCQLLFLPSWFSSSLPFFQKLEKAQEENAQHQGLTNSFPWLCGFLLVHSPSPRGVGTQPQPWHLQLLLLFRLRSISIKRQRSNTGCQAGEKIENERVLLVWKKKIVRRMLWLCYQACLMRDVQLICVLVDVILPWAA